MKTVKQGREFTGRVIYRHGTEKRKTCKGVVVIEIPADSNALATLLNTSLNRDWTVEETCAKWHVRTFGRVIEIPTCGECGGRIYFHAGEPVYGRFVETVVCGSKCTGAVGPSCDCSCGGANHGGGH